MSVPSGPQGPQIYIDPAAAMLAADVPVARLEAYDALRHTIVQASVRRLSRWSRWAWLAGIAVAFLFYFAPRAEPPHTAGLELLGLVPVAGLFWTISFWFSYQVRRRVAQGKWELEYYDDLDFENLSPQQCAVAVAAFRRLPKNMQLGCRRYFVNGSLTHLMLVVIHGQEEACVGAWSLTEPMELQMLSKADFVATSDLAARLGSKGVQLASLRSTLKLQAAWERASRDLRKKLAKRVFIAAAIVGLGTFSVLGDVPPSNLAVFVPLRVLWLILAALVVITQRRANRPSPWDKADYMWRYTPAETLSDLQAIQPLLEGDEHLVVKQLHDKRVVSPSIIYVQSGDREWPVTGWEGDGKPLRLDIASASGF